MGRPPYTHALLVAHAVTNIFVTIPATQRWVVSTLGVFYPGGSVAPSMSIIDVALDATVWWDSADVSVAGEWRYWAQIRLVLTEGKTYELNGLGTPDISLNGYLLTP